MKNLHKLKFLGLFDNFSVKLKLNFLSETGTYHIKKPTRERLQLLLNRFRVLIHEFFFLQNCIYLRKQPYWTTKSFAVYRIQRFDPRNP